MGDAGSAGSAWGDVGCRRLGGCLGCHWCQLGERAQRVVVLKICET